jgi:hypothetical protein
LIKVSQKEPELSQMLQVVVEQQQLLHRRPSLLLVFQALAVLEVEEVKVEGSLI